MWFTRNKRIFYYVLILIALLAIGLTGCTRNLSNQELDSGSPDSKNTEDALLPELTPTLLPTATPQPTETPIPTETPVPTTTTIPTPEGMVNGFLEQDGKVMQWKNGRLQEIGLPGEMQKSAGELKVSQSLLNDITVGVDPERGVVLRYDGNTVIGEYKDDKWKLVEFSLTKPYEDVKKDIDRQIQIKKGHPNNYPVFEHGAEYIDPKKWGTSVAAFFEKFVSASFNGEKLAGIHVDANYVDMLFTWNGGLIRVRPGRIFYKLGQPPDVSTFNGLVGFEDAVRAISLFEGDPSSSNYNVNYWVPKVSAGQSACDLIKSAGPGNDGIYPKCLLMPENLYTNTPTPVAKAINDAFTPFEETSLEQWWQEPQIPSEYLCSVYLE